VDKASVGIPYLYIATAATLAEAQQRLGNTKEVEKLMSDASGIAKATGLEGIFSPPAPRPEPAVPLESEKQRVPLGSDTGRSGP
jgi:hypothetical protein